MFIHPVSVHIEIQIGNKLVEVEASVDKWYDPEPDVGVPYAYFTEFSLCHLENNRELTDAEWDSISDKDMLSIEEALYDAVMF